MYMLIQCNCNVNSLNTVSKSHRKNNKPAERKQNKGTTTTTVKHVCAFFIRYPLISFS